MGSFVEDLALVRLCDARLEQRLARIVDAVSTEPSRSFPDAMSPSELLGYYRFVGNDDVSFTDIVGPHFEETSQRAQSVDDLLVVHDTSDFECSRLSFRGHFSLAVRRDRRPLGFLSILPSERGSHSQKSPSSPNEQDRWLWGMYFASQRCSKAIHVLDREGDDFNIFKQSTELGFRFVIRGRMDRKLTGGERMDASLSKAPIIVERTVPLSGRRRHGNKEDEKAHPPREERLAKLSITALPLEIKDPKQRNKSLVLNVVMVREIESPEGIEPVEWRLITTEKIDTAADVLRIVDIYRARWIIEEFFKALKTGCGFEKRQHESYHALLIALSILSPMALQMLQIRAASREEADLPATAALTEIQITILQTLERTRRLPLRSATDALMCVAALGGHLKNNGQPGWIVLGRGLEKLLAYEIGWQAAKAAKM